MANDEFQRAMERISRWQKKFDEGLKRARELYRSHTRQLEAAAANLRKTVVGYKKAQKDLAVKMTELAEAQAHTDQRLNVLIDIIEQGRGGPSAS